MHACELDPRFVLDETVTIDRVAGVIVHEATHARIGRCGIPYSKALRGRIEVVCHREEIAFARRLPDGALIRHQAEQAIARPYDPTDMAFQRAENASTLEALRYLGAPPWSLPFFRIALAVLRFAQRWKRRLSSK